MRSPKSCKDWKKRRQLKGKSLVDWPALRAYLARCKRSYVEDFSQLEAELQRPEAEQRQDQVLYLRYCIRSCVSTMRRLEALLSGKISHRQYVRMHLQSQAEYDKRRTAFTKRHGKDIRLTDDNRLVTKKRYDEILANTEKDE